MGSEASPLYNPSMAKPPYDRNFYRLPRHSRPDICGGGSTILSCSLFSKTKGITLVFKNDALESLLVGSTFDIVSSVKMFLQQQIESQLRTFLQDTLRLIVHEFSLRHINNQQQQQ
ncbi:hypothetical protein BCR42DRAFT_387712 [Absidia repens]|uniref:DM34 domain-containing protein n=1 Tax=Absidia repens TaxID=90262 RepID=A0A1X2IVT3_9FUNG|nr:hypothetical protein BCR42DRAFT_387712 [Absidia repens]